MEWKDHKRQGNYSRFTMVQTGQPIRCYFFLAHLKLSSLPHISYVILVRLVISNLPI